MMYQGVKLARTIGACFFQITEGKALPPFQKNVGFVRFKCKTKDWDGTVLNHARACGGDSANSRALVAAVALCKRLLNASFSTFSDSKCCLGGERRTETVVKASSWATC